jgi:hypothetical protein
MRPDTGRVLSFDTRIKDYESGSVPKTFHFLHPATHASGMFNLLVEPKEGAQSAAMKMKQACFVHQSCHQQAWPRQDLRTNPLFVAALCSW